MPNPNSSSNKDSAGRDFTSMPAFFPFQTGAQNRNLEGARINEPSIDSKAKSKNSFLDPEKRVNSRMLLFG